MKPWALFGLLGLGWLVEGTQLRPRNYDTNDYYVVHLDSTASPAQIAARLGLSHHGQLGELEDHHVFTGSQSDEDLVHHALKLRRSEKRHVGNSDLLDSIKFAQKQTLKPRLQKRDITPPRTEMSGNMILGRDGDQPVESAVQKQKEIMTVLEIQDPTFAEQWHLFNPVQLGHDVNVSNVWFQGITGFNTTVAIVDDGLDMYSDDLKNNYFAAGSYDFNDKDFEPKPELSDDDHGTRCAGEVAAVKNDVCGIGVAYDSKVAGIRILSALITDADEAEAMNYAYQENNIYSCSWGPPDDGMSMDAPGILIKRAMLNAVQKGRDGKGNIYVFASGNGANNGDNCNFDGYTNSIYSITVGALDRKGLHPFYSEKCSAQMVVTYSSGSGDAIHTTDRGDNKCTAAHGGTSAAAPLAAGIFALALSIRPELTWRDMQALVLQTAVPIDLDTGGWQETTIGKKYSHTFGYGKIDSWATVEAAKTFKSLKPQSWYFSPWMHVQKEIPQGDKGLSSSFEVTQDMLTDANLERVEHVTLTMNVEHGRRGDLSVDLISPNNIISHLSAPRPKDESQAGYNDWTFMSVIHWGESGVGKWTVVIRDTMVNDFNGNLTDWHLKLWGESIDPALSKLLPMPNSSDDDDHDQVILTTSIGAATTSLSSIPAASSISAVPSDQPDRPVNSKHPGETTAAAMTSSTTTSAPTSKSATGTASSMATKPPSPTSSTTSPASATASHSSWLPSFFPTFGVSARTQIWIYGSVALILVFCCGLGVYLFLARRKRLRNNPRDEWEFDLIEDEEGEGLNGGGGGGGGGARRHQSGKRRAGELYDAFAAGSEDESDFGDPDEDYKDEGGHVIGDDDDDDDNNIDEKEEDKKLLDK